MVRGFNAPCSTVDTKSIFVGNLPETVTRPELEKTFREFGRIIQVNVIRKNFSKLISTPSTSLYRFISDLSAADGGTNVFAFIGDIHCHEVDRAALAEGMILGRSWNSSFGIWQDRLKCLELRARSHAQLSSPKG
jgi:hypothetical protein